VRHHVSAAERGELHRVPADTTRRAGHQHPPPEERPEPADRTQRRHPGGRQRRGAGELDVVRDHREVRRPRGAQRGQRPAGAESGGRRDLIRVRRRRPQR
jgi:hypothetical protein